MRIVFSVFLAAGLVYFAVIEGQGRTLEEIDTMYLMKIKPWKSSKYVFPADPAVMRGSFEKENEAQAATSSHVLDPTTEVPDTVPEATGTRSQE